MTVRKLNIKRVIIFILIILFIIGGIIYLIKDNNKKNTIEYKLMEHGYSEEEVTELKNYMNNTKLEEVLKLEYDSNMVLVIKEKYFMFKNLPSYLSYIKEEKIEKDDIASSIAIINTNANKEYYEEMVDTDTSLNELMLVNKLNTLNKYIPDSVSNASLRYSYEGVKIAEAIVEPFENLVSAASDEGYTLVTSLSYRSYKEQKSLYDNYKDLYGTREADDVVAHPGSSEHQSGYAIEIEPYAKSIEDAETNEEHIWLMENAHNYGFILRYPSGKESITGYSYEPWHFRYVGVIAATTIYNENITFEEYYAYYVKGEQNE